MPNPLPWPGRDTRLPFSLCRDLTAFYLRDFGLSLWHNRDVFAPGVVFEHVTSEGPQAIPYDMGTFYRGQVRGTYVDVRVTCMYARVACVVASAVRVICKSRVGVVCLEVTKFCPSSNCLLWVPLRLLFNDPGILCKPYW